MPVLGSGHPQADVFLLKFAPAASEIEEGVAFYGRSGTALMKSLKRLGIDPLAVYGTLCVKCPVGDPSLADPACIARVLEELAIVAPKIVVVMGEDALATLNDLDVPLARPLDPELGVRPGAHAGVRRARRAEHRRGPRRGGRQARVLVGLQGAGRVVRGPAALLAVVGAFLAYVLVAPELPQLHPPELSALVACAIGLTFVVAIVAGLAAVADSPLALFPRGARRRRCSSPRSTPTTSGRPRRRSRSSSSAAWGSPSPSSSTCRRWPSPCRSSSAAIDIAQAHRRRLGRALHAVDRRSPATRSRSSCPTGAPGSRPPA